VPVLLFLPAPADGGAVRVTEQNPHRQPDSALASSIRLKSVQSSWRNTAA
jgi:hypothetical protein